MVPDPIPQIVLGLGVNVISAALSELAKPAFQKELAGQVVDAVALPIDRRSLASWIATGDVWWQLVSADHDAAELTLSSGLRRLIDDRQALMDLKQHCFETYRRHFSYSNAIEEWDRELRRLIA